MYFDNYLNPKPSSYNFNYSNNPSSLQYNPQNIQSTQPPSQNYKAFIQSKISETNQNFHLQFNKNQSTQPGNYRPFINQPAGTINPSIIDQKGLQKPSNQSFLNSQSSNLTQNQQKKDTLKRRDSNSIGNYFKQNQTHSPSFHANFLQQNKHQVKPNFAQQSHHNVHSMGRPALSTNNLNNFDLSTLKDPHRSTIIQTHINKDQNMSTSQLKFDQSKHSQKPYALGFRSKNQPLQFEIKKNKTIYEEKQKKFDTQNKDLSYNFQLRNTTTDWNTFSKPVQQGGQAKFLTPSNIKKQSQNEQANNDIQNYFSKVDNNLKQNQNTYRKDHNQTEREFGKSPSIDTLLSNAYYREAQYKKIQKGDLQNNENSFQSNKSKQTQPEQRVGSQGYFVEKATDKKPPIGKNYQALIQNLQKKFNEQKKSSDSFESKQKFYQNELNKKDEKIKRLQSIIENNKQTIGSLEQTINHFKKSNQLSVNFKGSAESLSIMVESLRKENELLKEELNQQRRNSLSLGNLNNPKDKFDKYQQKIKQLQATLTQSTKEIKSKQTQINSLRQSYSTLHQSYKNQFKQHQTTRQQLIKIKQNYEQLTKNIELKTQKIQQLNTQLVYLQSKYQSSLEKLLTQNQHFEKQKTSCQNIIKKLKIEKQTILQSEEKLKNQIKQLQNQLSLKHLQIQTLQEKVNQQISQEEEERATVQQKYQFYQNNNNNDYQQMNQQLSKKQQELRLKQQSIEELSLQLKRKTRLIEQISCQKTQLLSKIENFETKVEMLESQGKSKAQIKSEERSKKTSDSVEIKENIQSSQLNDQKQKQNLLSIYHEKYSQIVNIFNLLEKNQEIVSSTSSIAEQNSSREKPNPSKEYLDKYHNLITDEIKKIFKDLKKLVLALKECQAQSQLKNQRLYQLDKTLKKQVNKIGSLIAEIHMKNSAIADMNKMQLEKQIFRLNEKYQILNQITY